MWRKIVAVILWLPLTAGWVIGFIPFFIYALSCLGLAVFGGWIE